MGNNPIIRFNHISKKYGDKSILEEFNLDIFSGEFVTIIGSSGCGKTTILKMINGLNIPTQGEIFVNNEDISQINQNSLRRGIGYVIQGVGLFPHMTIKDNIAYVLKLLKLKKDAINQKVNDIMDVVNLDRSLLEYYPDELSGGQKQRVGIARALVANPKIILMDEPFGELDEITRKGLQDEILRIKSHLNATIIFITHDIKEALKLGSRVIVMDQGVIEQDDTPENLISAPKTDFVKALVQVE